MSDLRRSILWVIFGFAMVLLWDRWQVYNGRPATFFPSAQESSAQADPARKPVTEPSDIPQANGNGAASPDSAVPAAASAASAASQNVLVSTDVLRLTFAADGASLVQADLLKYADQEDKSQPVRLFTAAYAYQAQVGLIDGNGKATFPTHKTPMTLVPGPTTLAPGQDTLTLRFESAPVGGVKLARVVELHRGSYAVNVRNEVTNVGTTPVKPEMYMQLVRNEDALPGQSSFYHTFMGPAYYNADQKFRKVDFSDIAKGKADVNANTNNGWVAMVQHYFASAWLLPEGQERRFYTTNLGNNRFAIGMIAPLATLAPQATESLSATLFAGPQEERNLEALAPGLDLIKDYGWFTILSKPLFWLLTVLHGFLHNWGWAIVALVVLLKAAFFWLNASAYRSMAKMKAVAPRIEEMRKRLKDTPQEMQKEMMRIYREEKINPIGGCLPIVIQIPFFIALYWVLLSSVEMRNAPWIGWIHDLSVRDPYFILPIVMTLSTVLQTWLNPKPADPMQAKMMWIMPLAFSVMFFMFPAGLVLYWVTNNLLSIAQQWFINKRMGVTK